MVIVVREFDKPGSALGRVSAPRQPRPPRPPRPPRARGACRSRESVRPRSTDLRQGHVRHGSDHLEALPSSPVRRGTARRARIASADRGRRCCHSAMGNTLEAVPIRRAVLRSSGTAHARVSARLRDGPRPTRRSLPPPSQRAVRRWPAGTAHGSAVGDAFVGARPAVSRGPTRTARQCRRGTTPCRHRWKGRPGWCRSAVVASEHNHVVAHPYDEVRPDGRHALGSRR